MSFSIQQSKPNTLKGEFYLMRLHEYLDGASLLKGVTDGTIRAATHDTLPLTLYTYTEKAQFAGQWSDAERKCRGLVVEDTGLIIAMCMPKFFNYSEHANGKSYAAPLPDEEFEIFEKMDGSLGTVFFYEDRWHVASKGSFHSDQAQWATRYLQKRLYPADYLGIESPTDFDPLNSSKTYICEIVYPSNRIVVDYGNLEDLVFLTAYDTSTGVEDTSWDRKLEWGWVGSVVASYDPYSLSVAELQELADENVMLGDLEYLEDREVAGHEHEGYVIRFSSGIRCKVKLTDYIRLHKVLTGCSERAIWEKLRDGEDLNEWLANVPDELYDWVREVEERILRTVTEYVRQAFKEYEELQSRSEALGVHTKKDYFFYIESSEWKEELLLIQDLKLSKLHKKAWQLARPEHVTPFKDIDV